MLCGQVWPDVRVVGITTQSGHLAHGCFLDLGIPRWNKQHYLGHATPSWTQYQRSWLRSLRSKQFLTWNFRSEMCPALRAVGASNGATNDEWGEKTMETLQVRKTIQQQQHESYLAINWRFSAVAQSVERPSKISVCCNSTDWHGFKTCCGIRK